MKKMAKRSITESLAAGNVPQSFGAFYPTGHIVIMFANKGDAERAREALLTGGHEEDEVIVLSSDDAVSRIEDMLTHVSRLAIGSETQHMRERLELATQGCEEMIVYAPTEHETKRVMNVARRFDIRLAEAYHRLTIEHLDVS